MNYALGCDVSHWQGEVNFAKMYDAGARFVFLKASQANWTDGRFAANYAMARKTPLLVGVYHYLDWTAPAVEQARYFAKIVADYPPDLPPVVDYEERKSAPERSKAIAQATAFMAEFENLTGRAMMIYTSPGYWKEFGLGESPFFASRPLWIAHYGVNNPTVPRPWSTWEFWQYTDRGDGRRYGVSSRQIDLNYFNGTEQELFARYGKHEAQQSVGVQQPHPATMVRLRVTVPVLNVRQAPSSSSARVGQLAQGTIVNIEDIHVEGPARVWARHAGGWSAVVYDGNILMREVS
jgi:lysozyme